jgi:hypothetical protein
MIITRVYPPQKAIARAATELTTDEKALVAHAHGMTFFPSCSKRRIPVGKGNPIKNPRGNIMDREMKNLTAIPKPISALKKVGRIKL